MRWNIFLKRIHIFKFSSQIFFLLLRPKCYAEDREDKDIYEILDIVSPPRSPNSKAKTPPSKNSLFDELKTKEVYQDNFLEELQAKYDTRKKDREVLIKEEEVKAKYSRFVLYISSFKIGISGCTSSPTGWQICIGTILGSHIGRPMGINSSF